MDSFFEQAVYIPLTVSSTLAVYNSSLEGLDPEGGKGCNAGGCEEEAVKLLCRWAV